MPLGGAPTGAKYAYCLILIDNSRFEFVFCSATLMRRPLSPELMSHCWLPSDRVGMQFWLAYFELVGAIDCATLAHCGLPLDNTNQLKLPAWLCGMMTMMVMARRWRIRLNCLAAPVGYLSNALRILNVGWLLCQMSNCLRFVCSKGNAQG